MRIFFAIVTLIFIVIASIVFRARPQYSGELDVLGVKSDAEVLYDEYGIPHIYAESDEDAYRVLGYVHAQERLFQMELLRRAGGGRLAEIFGPDLVDVDRMFRTFGLDKKAAEDAAYAEAHKDEEVYRLAFAYLDGVNTYIDEGRTPLEFTIAGIPLQHFEAKDMQLIAGAMSFNFAQGLRVDPVLSYIKDNLGQEYIDALELGTPKENVNVPVHPPREIPRLPIDEQRLPIEPFDSLPNIGMHRSTDALHDYLDMGIGVFYGSNTWAIARENTEDGVTLLANDTHIGYAQPCTWFEAHLEYPGTRIYGTFMAGIPFPLTGRNEQSAWGVTMLLNDDMDLYCESVNEDETHYFFRGEKRPIERYTDTIQVKGEDDIHFEVARTHHGPIVSDFIAVKDPADVVSMSWTYLDHPSRLLEAFYALGKSHSMAEAKEAVYMIDGPGLNISYANADGDIALWAAASLRDRPAHVEPKYMLDGSSGEDDLLGYRPSSDNPVLENPPWGYVYSCNNLHDTYPGIRPIDGYYEPDDRASRVLRKLSSRSDWSMEGMKRLILDDHSDSQSKVSSVLVHVLKAHRGELNEIESEAFELVREWDGRHGIDQVGPTIHYKWVYHLLESALKDELGAVAFQEMLKVNALKPSILKMVMDENSPWWDNIKTAAKEDLDDIVFLAFQKSVATLAEQQGDTPVEWTWGKAHQTLHKHAFSDIPLIGNWMNVGPFPSPGGVETVNNSMFYLSDDEVIYAKHGPQMRRLVNLNDIDNSLSILPTGQSGMKMSPHYSDQAEMYIRGQFRPQHMNRKKILRNAKTLIFKAPAAQ